MSVERARDQLLAGAALPFNQNRGAAGCCLYDQVEHLTQSGTSADYVIEIIALSLKVLAKRPIFYYQTPLLNSIP